MKITWNWLGEYVDLTGLTPEQVAEDLTSAGIPVEKMASMNSGVDGVVVGLIESVTPHPQADRLRVCKIDTGTTKLQIVTGATNVQAGQKVPVALVGAKLPEKHIELANFRGLSSEGMLCSASELGLDDKFLPKDQAEGIWIFPEDAPLGENVVEYLGLNDMVMELELTPNRSDCLSFRGVAYEVAALYSREVHMPDADASGVATAGDKPLSVRIDTELCTGYSGQVVTHLVLGPSPMWMQMRLLAVGMRPINNLVDITNYVMFEWGQPLHAFDYDAILNQEIVVRQAKDREILRTLDSQDRELTSDVIVISDHKKGLGLAGVMGGENSEVTGSTTTVVIESAMFDPMTTRRTSRRLQLRSEAALRFEKGLDPDAVLPALHRASALMVQYAGGELVGAPVITGKDLISPRVMQQIHVRTARVADVLGYVLAIEELEGFCHQLGLPVVREEAGLRVSIPARRPDLIREEDMIEEFARLAGFDRIPSTNLEGVLSHGGLSKTQKLRRMARDYMRNQGFDEVWTYSFVDGEVHRKLNIADDHELARPMRLLNPLSEDREALRTTMLVPLLDVAKYNASRQWDSLFVFELGTVFLPAAPNGDKGMVAPVEKKVLAGVAYGSVAKEPLYAGRNYDFFDIKGLVEGLFERLGIKDIVNFERMAYPYLHAGRSAEILVGGNPIGKLGQVRKEVAKTFDLAAEVYYFEVEMDALVQMVSSHMYVAELPRHPQVERDLAVVVNRTLSVANLFSTVKAAAGSLLESVSVFDVYTGNHVSDEEKSVALRLVFRAPDRTLTENEVQTAVDQVLSQLNSNYGAVLRK